jgi:mRNA interferase MazF
MNRGDVLTVAATGNYGKPRPPVIVQADALPSTHASVVVCQMTSECSDAVDFRVTIEPTAIEHADHVFSRASESLASTR